MVVRSILIVIPDIAIPRTIDGNMNIFILPMGLSPNLMRKSGGMCPHQVAGKTTSIVPSQKPGIEMQRIENERPK
jgi:hypothetical protein